MRTMTIGLLLPVLIIVAVGCPKFAVQTEEAVCNIVIRKINDLNANGILDDGEPEIGDAETGWPVFYTDPAGVEYVGATPVTCIETAAVGTWTFWEGSVDGWNPTGATVNGEPVVEFTSPIPINITGEGEELYEIVFLNTQVQEECSLRIRKINDLNANGLVDDGEPEIGVAEFVNDAGWPLFYSDPAGTQFEEVTPACILVDTPGVWTFQEGSVDGWIPTGAILNNEEVVEFEAPIEIQFTGEEEEPYELIFLNVQVEEECNIRIRKFDDVNGNGVLDDGEPEIGLTELINDGGWPVFYSDPAGTEVETTTPACFAAPTPGTWTFWEGSIDGWIPTGATVNGEAVTDPIAIEITGEGEETYEIIFLNVREEEEVCNLRIRKFEDLNANGELDAGEPEIGVTEYINDAGWSVFYSDPNGAESQAATPACVTVEIPGLWTVWEGAVDGWVPTGAFVNWLPVVEFTSPIEVEFTGACEEAFEIIFLNTRFVPPQTGTICALKVYDYDGNGYSDNDAPIEGFRLYLDGCDNEGNVIGPIVKFTDASGTACWEDLAPGNYTVCEDLPIGHWRATSPTCAEVELNPGTTEQVYFSNYCRTKIEMKSKGWWHSKHGCAVIAAHPDLLDALNALTPYASGVVYVGGKCKCDCGCDFDKSKGNGNGKGDRGNGDRESDDDDCDRDDCDRDDCDRGCEDDDDCDRDRDCDRDDCDCDRNCDRSCDRDCNCGQGKKCKIYLPFDDCCELSRFLVAPNSQDHRIGLAQQLAAFVLNVMHESGSFELYFPSECMTAEEIINAAIEAWQCGCDVNYWKSVLDRLNNGRTFCVISPVPCDIVYCD